MSEEHRVTPGRPPLASYGPLDAMATASDAARRMHEAAAAIAELESVAVYILDTSRTQLWRSAAIPEPPAFRPPDLGIVAVESELGKILVDGRHRRLPATSDGLGPTTVVPIIVLDRPMGVVTATWANDVAPVVDDEFATIVASEQMTLALVRATWGARREIARSGVIQRIGAASLDVDHIDDLLAVVVQEIHDAMGADAVMIYQVDHRIGRLLRRAATGIGEQAPVEAGLSNTVARTAFGGKVGDVTNVPRAAFGAILAGLPEFDDVLTMTLRVAGTVTTSLVVARRGATLFTGTDRRLLKDLAGTVGSALEIKEVRGQLEAAANTDALTGLANRFALTTQAERAVRAMRPGSPGLAVILIDLDEFKVVNDSLGHGYGDRVLRSIGARLAAATRPRDIIARLGGDEFAVLASDVDEHVAVKIAERLLAAISEPVELDRSPIVLRASAGVALLEHCDADSDDPIGLDAMLQGADLALYRSKARGRGRVTVYDVALRDELRRHLAIQEGLRHAIANGGLRLLYQPIVDLGTGEVNRVEALVRFDHPVLGPIPPDQFVPIAERAGLIRDLDDWVLRTAAAQVVEWTTERPDSSCRVAVNLSATDLHDAAYVNRASDILSSVGCRPDQVTVELTEAVVADAAVVEAIRVLADRGIFAAIDDFGSGYSSLGLLRKMPVRSLKLDRTFVADVATDPTSMMIVRTVIELAHALDQAVIAEGIETVEQLRVLRAIGCTGGQGYLMGRPMAADAIVPFLTDGIPEWAGLVGTS